MSSYRRGPLQTVRSCYFAIDAFLNMFVVFAISVHISIRLHHTLSTYISRSEQQCLPRVNYASTRHDVCDICGFAHRLRKFQTVHVKFAIDAIVYVWLVVLIFIQFVVPIEFYKLCMQCVRFYFATRTRCAQLPKRCKRTRKCTATAVHSDAARQLVHTLAPERLLPLLLSSSSSFVNTKLPGRTGALIVVSQLLRPRPTSTFRPGGTPVH